MNIGIVPEYIQEPSRKPTAINTDMAGAADLILSAVYSSISAQLYPQRHPMKTTQQTATPISAGADRSAREPKKKITNSTMTAESASNILGFLFTLVGFSFFFICVLLKSGINKSCVLG